MLCLPLPVPLTKPSFVNDRTVDETVFRQPSSVRGLTCCTPCGLGSPVLNPLGTAWVRGGWEKESPGLGVVVCVASMCDSE